MRYKLMQICPGEEESEVGGQRKMTKANVEQWIEDNVTSFGLDWRVGYQIKFKNSDTIYKWLTKKDSKLVR